jgi:GNAT superfamily N-acetyltransferase
MALTYALESLETILVEAMHLWKAHWDETEGYREVQGYDPDLAQFIYLDRNNMFREFTVRDEFGKLVGHLGYILHNSRHTKRKAASEDFFYLLPEHRQGMNAMKLLRFAVAQLKDDGCVEIGMSSKLTNDIAPLLKRAGFKHVAQYYMMNVEENLET